MKRFISISILTLLAFMACEKVSTSSSDYVITGDSVVSGKDATLKAKLTSSVDLASVSSTYFLVSEDAKVPEKKARKVEATLTDRDLRGKASDLEYAKQYYYRAVVVINKKTHPGKIKDFTTDPLKVTRIQILNKHNNLLVGEKLKIEYKITPEDATNQNVEFYVYSGYGYVGVEKDGTVTAYSAGKSDVAVKTEDGGYTDLCEFNVRSVCPPEGVDLGLSVYWAKQNVNTNGWVESIEDKGTYFSYPSKAYQSQLLPIPYSSLGSSFWGVPTKDQVLELLTYCTIVGASLNDVQGVRVTGKNGNTIFLPNAEYYTDTNTGTSEHTDPSNNGIGGYHWNYYTFIVDSGTIKIGTKCGRYASYVRPVLL